MALSSLRETGAVEVLDSEMTDGFDLASLLGRETPNPSSADPTPEQRILRLTNAFNRFGSSIHPIPSGLAGPFDVLSSIAPSSLPVRNRLADEHVSNICMYLVLDRLASECPLTSISCQPTILGASSLLNWKGNKLAKGESHKVQEL